MAILSKSALLVIDAQKGLLIPEGKQPMPCVDVRNAVRKIAEVLEIFRRKKLPIIHFMELHRKEMVDFGRELDGTEGVHCIEGTKDAEIIDEVKPSDGEFIIGKRRYSGFFATDLDLLLRGLGIETVYITGFLTDVCVHYTAVDAHQYNYRVRIVEDAVRGSSWEAHQAAIKAIRYLQREAIISIEDLF
ncbi:isochorismatase hydrolase [Desulfotomaculum nigrificans CO-1-SRB]|uniref:Isochorismatase hydrolase n=1 Tax=Desulfotomaculum nigrificans (strain DSM 14880 / VKM B-2319 / CO-1-SRB) TaxID=868595 RepID=F6B312_DESCC|nr:isochorismatase family cysteine hydrolase [Desulfotomaculum nigrificans]AEF93916.1 isochorismatase hydrolase [Desulfotomaculum nigrificans CO-1-SRB]